MNKDKSRLFEAIEVCIEQYEAESNEQLQVSITFENEQEFAWDGEEFVEN